MPEFDSEDFLGKLTSFLTTVKRDFSAADELSRSDAVTYCTVKIYMDGGEAGRNDNGSALVKPADVVETARYAFGMKNYSYYTSVYAYDYALDCTSSRWTRFTSTTLSPTLPRMRA